MTAEIRRVELGEHALTAHWSDGRQSRFHYLWLRDNCASGFHPDTRERTFDLLSVSEAIHPVNVNIDATGLRIEWSEHAHTSHYRHDWLAAHDYSQSGRRCRERQRSALVSWDAADGDDPPRADYAELMTDDAALYRWMQALYIRGLALVDGMPDDDNAVLDASGRIDYPRRTNFGITFNVISEPNPINLAYTALTLPLHTDLPNQETPPGFQFLHCRVNQSNGGDSIFVDGLRVLEMLREQAPAHFDLLAEHAIPFRFHDDEHDIRAHNPIINLDAFGNIVEIKYNAHVADTFDSPEAVMHDLYLAYRDLMRRLREPHYQLRLRLAAGQMAVFDNRRVLHGRTGFDPNSGPRYLRGCYVDRTEFKSRLRMLAKRFEPDWSNFP